MDASFCGSPTHIVGLVCDTLQYPLHSWHKQQVIAREVQSLEGQDVLYSITVHLGVRVCVYTIGFYPWGWF